MDSPDELPLGWAKVKSKSHPNKHYFYNQQLKKSVWKLSDINKKFTPKNISVKSKPSMKSPEKLKWRMSAESKVIGKKNIAEQRMKKLKMALNAEIAEKDPNFNERRLVTKTKSCETITSKEPSFKKVKKTNLSPRKRAERKDPEESMEMEVDAMSSQEVNKSIEEFDDTMEWEAIDEKEVIKEVLHVRSLKSNATSVITRDTINHVHENKFYIVVDTNIFCSNLQFIERIKGIPFKNLGNICIFIPYIVLCELDMLKTRDGSISKAAQRAIKLINKYFEGRDVWVMGQSVKEDTRELIPIESGDDRILNCAFQLNDTTSNVLILSNDTNLRNKANFNKIEACSADMLNYKLTV